MANKNLQDETAVRIWESNVTSKQLLNEQEKQIFRKLISLNTKLGNGKFIICPQVNISSFADFSDEDKALWDFNKLSVDFLVINKDTYKPLMAIEYYGGGHYGYAKTHKELSKIKIRDLCKQILCYKIQIELQIICFDDIFYYDNSEEVKFSKEADNFFQKIFENLRNIETPKEQILENELDKAKEYIKYLQDKNYKLSYHLDEAEKYIANLEN